MIVLVMHGWGFSILVITRHSYTLLVLLLYSVVCGLYESPSAGANGFDACAPPSVAWA